MKIPYLTADLAGTGGLLKQQPEDFCVEEIPAYLPCGSGEHLYLLVEKEGLSTFALIEQLSQILRLPRDRFGYAGLKDTQARSRQWLSIAGARAEQLEALTLPQVRLLQLSRHGNKLRLGHLRGNRFSIRLRQVENDAPCRAEAILQQLQQQGVPNRFGPQRYGVLGNNAAVGRALLQQDFDRALAEIIGPPARITNERWRQAAEAFAAGDQATACAALPAAMRDERRLLQQLQQGRSPRQAVLGLPRKRLALYLSAWQSAFFDTLVTERLTSLGQLWPGDIAYIHAKGACFRVSDAVAEQPRANAGEISPAGLLPGSRALTSEGAMARLEQQLLVAEQLPADAFTALKGLHLTGERRPLRVFPADCHCQAADADLMVRFSLPAGCFATSVLREIRKTATED
ncbi:MAG: tRNA pseudouridine(13) synthase TruD [Desulfuromonas thiophila]|nr:tRNA pseudouridine(13) synthase TruD [Desulfuromonas thiophila]